jgi:hypothetical protein
MAGVADVAGMLSRQLGVEGLWPTATRDGDDAMYVVLEAHLPLLPSLVFTYYCILSLCVCACRPVLLPGCVDADELQRLPAKLQDE